MSRATRSPNANSTRDWRIYANFAERLIGIARGLYAEEPFGVDLAETVYALDATTIDLCLSVLGVQRDGHGIVLVTYRADPVYIIGGFLEVCDILSSLSEVIATRVNVAET